MLIAKKAFISILTLILLRCADSSGLDVRLLELISEEHTCIFFTNVTGYMSHHMWITERCIHNEVLVPARFSFLTVRLLTVLQTEQTPSCLIRVYSVCFNMEI